MPITWRNVSNDVRAPDLNGVASIMNTGANSISSGLDRLQSVAQGIGDTRIQNWNTVKDNNTDNYLAQIAAAHDMDTVTALKASLDPTQLTNQYGAQIDSRAVMGALQDQGRFVRQDMMEQAEADDFNTLRGVRNLKAEAENYARQTGDIAGAQQMLAQSGAEDWAVSDSFNNLSDIENVLEQRNQARQRLAMDQSRLNMSKQEFAQRQQDRLREQALDNAVAVGLQNGESLIQMQEAALASAGGNLSASDRVKIASGVAATYAAFSGIEDPNQQQELVNFAINEQPRMALLDDEVIAKEIPVDVYLSLGENPTFQSATKKLQNEIESSQVALEAMPEQYRPDVVSPGKTIESIIRDDIGRLGTDTRSIDWTNPMSLVTELQGITINPEDAAWLGEQLAKEAGVSDVSQLPVTLVLDVFTSAGLNRASSSGETQLNRSRINQALPNVVQRYDENILKAANLIRTQQQAEAVLNRLNERSTQLIDNKTTSIKASNVRRLAGGN